MGELLIIDYMARSSKEASWSSERSFMQNRSRKLPEKDPSRAEQCEADGSLCESEQ